jgi:hypothetical protein
VSVCFIKFFSVQLISLFNIYAIDIYPTTINGIGTGILRFCGQIGASLAVIPYGDIDLIVYGNDYMWQAISLAITILVTLLLLIFLK